jgi:hypothetical protein
MSTHYGRARVRQGGFLDIGSFSGGREDGVCLQLTPNPPAEFHQLTRVEAIRLADLIEDFLIATRTPGADR